jgi:metal-responsive CopG/Arc/MetJ family transcriptional regulator
MNGKQKVTISLPLDVLSYADRYKTEHGIATRSEVLAIALRLLRERELVAGYRAMAEEQAKDDDPWLDSDLGETLEGIDKG